MNKFRTVGQLDFLSPLNGYSQITTKLTQNDYRRYRAGLKFAEENSEENL
jgi:hypothetical protein